ncbi:MAG: LicD family protein [Clostridium sp.]|uniref:LicD family protein n=1 Tax=Clostridium sp. TaxID=1506 RepID=UPI00290D5AAE|nr:LicD family protein [Clostridium sp.]MDU4937992.1 LicD family protein [Clostridium sp.]
MIGEYEESTLKKLQGIQLGILKDFIDVCKKYDLKYFLIFGTAIGAARHKGFIPWDDDIDIGMLRSDYDKFIDIMDKEMGEKYKLLTPEIDSRYACMVTHLQKKNTKFISHNSQDLKCDLCIDIDIFIYDNLSDDEVERKSQLKRGWFLGKLLYLVGTPKPNIPLKGLSYWVSRIICYCTHYILKIFNIKANKVYGWANKIAAKYNENKTKYVTTFASQNPQNVILSYDEIFPLKEVDFEEIKVTVIKNNHEYLTRIYGDYMQLPPEDKRVNHSPVFLEM